MMKARRLRVLHVVQNLNYGGMERVLSDIVRFVDATRFESHVLCLQYLGRFAAGIETRAGLHVAPPLGRLSMVWPHALIRAIRGIAPDVVHTHSGVWYKASLAAVAAGVPLVLHTEHGRTHDDPLLHRLLDMLAARRTDVVVAVSDDLADYLRSALHVAADRIAVVRNGIDTTEYAPMTDDGHVRRELGVPCDVPIIGSIGRLEHVKGYDVMLRAFRNLLDMWRTGPAPMLLVAGEGAERARLTDLADRLGLNDRLRFLGWRDDPHELHASFTLFTLASRSEGTSISLLEAMAAGLCPVVTDVGGNRAVVGELAHRLVPAEDASALAAAWHNALTDAAARHQDGERARRRVLEHFSVAEMVRRYEAIYSRPPARSANS